MRNLKKVLALVLAMAMSLSLAVSAGAAFNDQDKIVNTEAVDMCSALNIINGYTDGSFKPEGNVTRAEAAKMICIALNGGKEPVLSASATPIFADIAGHWAAKYVEYCNSLGIVAGKSATQFDPNGNVTGVELAKMLLIALGYDAENEKFVGGNWDTNVNVIASQKDLYKDLESIDPAVALSRDNAAQMIWNALLAKMVDYDYKLSTDANGNLVSELKVEDEVFTLLGNKYDTIDTKLTTGILSGASYNTTKEVYTYTITTDVKDAVKTFETDANYVELMGHNVTFVAAAKDDVYGAFAEESVAVVSGLVGDITADKEGKFVVTAGAIEIDDVDYDVDEKYTVEVYTIAKNAVATAKVALQPYFTFNAIDNDDDGDIDLVIVMPVQFGAVKYVASDYVRINDVNGGEKMDTEEEYSVYEGIAKDDMALLSGDLTLKTNGTVTKMEMLTGTVEAMNSDGTITINGTDYTNVSGTKLDNDDAVEFYVINGYIVKAEVTTAADLSDFAVVTDYASNANTIYGPQAKLLFTDGTEQIVDVDDTDYSDYEKQLVTFEVEDGEYTLKLVDKTTVTGFDKNGGAAVDGDASFNNAEKGKSNATIGTSKAKINADAVVFVFDGKDEFSVITGAELAKVNDGETAVHFYGADENSNNYPFVSFAYVTSSELVTSDTAYGYVVSTVKTTGTGDDAVMSFTMWNGTADVPVVTEAGVVDTAVVKGALVSYTTNAAGEIDAITVLSEDKAATGRVDAIATFDGEDTLTIASYPGKTFVIDEDDTTVLFIDKTNGVGEADGVIQAADAMDGEGLYNNILFIGDYNGGTLKLLVVDVDNDWADAQ